MDRKANTEYWRLDPFPLTLNNMGKQWAYSDAFSRNLGLISLEEQEVLKNKRVAIAGMGGVGGVHLATLACVRSQEQAHRCMSDRLKDCMGVRKRSTVGGRFLEIGGVAFNWL